MKTNQNQDFIIFATSENGYIFGINHEYYSVEFDSVKGFKNLRKNDSNKILKRSAKTIREYLQQTLGRKALEYQFFNKQGMTSPTDILRMQIQQLSTKA